MVHSPEWWIEENDNLTAPETQSNAEPVAASGAAEPLLPPSFGATPPALEVRTAAPQTTDSSRVTICCHGPSMYIFYATTALSASIGIASLLYAIFVQLVDGESSFAVKCVLAWLYVVGTISLLSSGLGFIGVYSDVWRYSITLSSYLSLPLAFLHFIVLMMMYFDRRGLLRFMDDNKKALMLNFIVIDFFRASWPLVRFFVLTSCLSDVFRFFLLRRLKLNFETENYDEGTAGNPGDVNDDALESQALINDNYDNLRDDYKDKYATDKQWVIKTNESTYNDNNPSWLNEDI
mmetsp:Transcript_481/g.1115  ORF Transcript_481/g.1115 Transcript_481/m.1115 type:complete len:292 (+) Transcript_481:600-1475(+)|eukprot:CAMPEP_0194303978 /NCGR_PEP_ID=MMETSP0171-20130528/1780_1 /TAXON_ID=218684 /ORGANISM="Corethron pennatum, Strain L29A3" /LENGTH=291 /DNA_ID=CAMNT_0039055073 /DNA_START=599 /DNA_END=1474 /DNA_ORIENTATION=+